MYYSPFNQFQNYSIRQESITRVTGEEGAKAYQMAPNSSAVVSGMAATGTNLAIDITKQ